MVRFQSMSRGLRPAGAGRAVEGAGDGLHRLGAQPLLELVGDDADDRPRRRA